MGRISEREAECPAAPGQSLGGRGPGARMIRVQERGGPSQVCRSPCCALSWHLTLSGLVRAVTGRHSGPRNCPLARRRSRDSDQAEAEADQVPTWVTGSVWGGGLGPEEGSRWPGISCFLECPALPEPSTLALVRPAARWGSGAWVGATVTLALPAGSAGVSVGPPGGLGEPQPGGPVSPLFTEKGSAGRRRGSEAATAQIGLDQQPCVHLSGKGGRITPQAPPLTKSSTFVGRSWWVPRGSPEGEGAGSPLRCAVLVPCRPRAPGTATVPGRRPRFCGLPTVGTEPGLWPPLRHPPRSCEGPGRG